MLFSLSIYLIQICIIYCGTGEQPRQCRHPVHISSRYYCLVGGSGIILAFLAQIKATFLCDHRTLVTNTLFQLVGFSLKEQHRHQCPQYFYTMGQDWLTGVVGYNVTTQGGTVHVEQRWVDRGGGGASSVQCDTYSPGTHHPWIQAWHRLLRARLGCSPNQGTTVGWSTTTSRG